MPLDQLPPLPPPRLTGGGIRREAAEPRQLGGRGRAWPSPGQWPPFTRYGPKEGSPSESRRAAAIRGFGGGLGPPPIHLLPLSRRGGRGGWGVRAAPTGQAARRSRRYRSDTYPCQAAAGEEGATSSGEGQALPRTPIRRGAAASQQIPALVSRRRGRGAGGEGGPSGLGREARMSPSTRYRPWPGRRGRGSHLPKGGAESSSTPGLPRCGPRATETDLGQFGAGDGRERAGRADSYRCSTPPSATVTAASISSPVAARKSPGIVCFRAWAAAPRARARGRSAWSRT